MKTIMHSINWILTRSDAEFFLSFLLSCQDVSEFSHKLLDWLEDAFQLAANGK